MIELRIRTERSGVAHETDLHALTTPCHVSLMRLLASSSPRLERYRQLFENGKRLDDLCARKCAFNALEDAPYKSQSANDQGKVAKRTEDVVDARRIFPVDLNMLALAPCYHFSTQGLTGKPKVCNAKSEY